MVKYRTNQSEIKLSVPNINGYSWYKPNKEEAEIFRRNGIKFVKIKIMDTTFSIHVV